MKILRVRAHDFGKLNGALDLAPGLSVVHGPNEAGKSTWLQAIFAGLCGRRRGRGANTLEEREFERQYGPWNGKPWRATVKFELDDRRRIEIQQRDLKAKESVAHDADTGRPIGDELIYSGSIDGSRFLGLNRQVMPSTLVIAQGDIQRLRQKKGDEASALREELQRAAASEGGAATAVQALSNLKSYAGTRVGTERKNSTRPLQRAIDRAARADQTLEAGRRRHQERGRIEDSLRAASDRAERANLLVEACEQVRTERELKRLGSRLAEIERLEGLFPDSEPPPIPAEAPDAAKAKELREAAFEYGRRPEAPPEPKGPSVEEMARKLADLPEAAEGDREVAPEVAAAASRWREAREARAVRERLGPGDPPQPAAAPASEPVLRRALSALEAPPPEPFDDLERRVEELAREEAAQRTERRGRLEASFGRWPWIGAVGGTLLGLLGTLEIVPRAVGAGGWLLAVLGWILIYIAQKRARLPSMIDHTAGMDLFDARAQLRDLKRQHRRRRHQGEAAARDLAPLGVEPDVSAVRRALDDLRRRDAWERERSGWQERVASAREAEEAAERALRGALSGRGVEDAEAPAAALLDRYESACHQNLALASGTDRRQALTARLEARQQLDRTAAHARNQGEAAEARFRAALIAAGFPGDSTTDPEQWAADWLEQRERHLHLLRNDWGQMQRLLDGRTRQELQTERDALLNRLNALSDTGLVDSPGLEELTEDALERKLADARRSAAEATNEASNYEGRLDADADLPPLAELEEEQAAAEREVALLRRAAAILETAQEHLEAAQDEVHRMLAPDLREALAEHLSLVTGGRYSDVRIDPEEGLEVRLEVEDGIYRPATELSHGTVDQVYLLLRIALAEALGDRTESAPLFLDDATVHIDTDRTMRFLDLLLALSKERQIVVFTQEEEVREWAERSLAGDAKHCLIELDRDGLPLQPRSEADSGDGDGSREPAPAAERQHSLL